jgi:Uma2 family endonuclease
MLPRMSTQPPLGTEPGRISIEQWAALDEESRGELVDGTLVEEEVPGTIHELLVAWLCETLRRWGRPAGVIVFASGLRLALSPRLGRIPDVAVYLPASRRPQLRGAVDVPPSLVVEVVSPGPRDARRDRVEKLHDYAAFGVRWYWLVDPELRSFEILELGADGRYAHALAVTGGLVEKVPGCDGLSLDVGAAWEEIDALIKAVES